MEEGYLALRWNNHNTIFTKILNLLREQEAYTDVSLACEGRMYSAHKFVLSTCSDLFKEMFCKTPCKHPIVFMNDVSGRDLEYLLDFMYKGEVHVSQSELGSLLRTAEGLQVKGLAVPDDSGRASAALADIPGIASMASSLPVSNRLYSVKRKRSLDQKEEPPKLTPRFQPLKGKRFNMTKEHRTGLAGSPAVPQLKRMKTEEKIRNNNNLVPESEDAILDLKESPLQNEDLKIHLPAKVKVECDFDQLKDAIKGICDGENGKLDGASGDDMDDEGDLTDERGNPNSPTLNSELDETSSPNSEISTAELLQVDLSEDGTRFIIGPGDVGGEASRASSGAGDDEGNGTPKKPFICLLCGHTFTRRDNLANHLKTHTGDRPFMCQYCHKCFSRKDYLKQHERIHTGEKPYSCEICTRAFTRKEGLTDHMRCHSDYKAFSCEMCGKSFKQKCGLRFHKRNYKH